MSVAEILQEASKLTASERKELLIALSDVEEQDRERQLPADKKEFVSFAEAAAHLIGSVESNISDLSTDKKHLEGFGRD